MTGHFSKAALLTCGNCNREKFFRARPPPIEMARRKGWVIVFELGAWFCPKCAKAAGIADQKPK